MLLRLIKNWTLPLAMLAGTAGYFLVCTGKTLFERVGGSPDSGFDFCTIAANLL